MLFSRPSVAFSALSMLLLAPWAATADSIADEVDRSSLSGAVVCGYQGWFRCPGDGSPPGTTWTHWSRGGSDIGPGFYTIDLWPDVSECDPDELFVAPNVMLTNGETGRLFSSASRKTVERHFRWMRDTGIDGVFLQRFINPTATDPDKFTSNNIVLENVRRAANLYGRGFAVEYDCSGSTEATLYDQLVTDWQYLHDVLHIHEDPAYWHHNGEPVVIIWGLGFNSDSRPFSAGLASQVIDFFQNDPTYGGNYCIGGIPTGWRDLSRDSRTNPAWAGVYRSWDAICPWTVGRYNSPSSAQTHKTDYWLPDLQECNTLGKGYMPVVWPGFSWDNLQQLPPGQSVTPRLDGEFLWSQMHAVADIGVDMLFVAMFDEVDEGTAIFKVADHHPMTDHWLTYEGMPHDWYMRLAGAASSMLRGQIPVSEDFPIAPDCNGVEAFLDLGDGSAASISLVTVADGDTVPATIGGRACQTNAVPGSDRYVYFAIDDAFASAGNEPQICMYVDYFDIGTARMRMQYDALDGSHYKATGWHQLTNTNRWKRHVFQVSDALLSNGQNGGADLRIEFTGDSTDFYIGRFTVGTPRPAPAGMVVNAANAGCIVGVDMPAQDRVFTVRNTGVMPLNFEVVSNTSWATPTLSTAINTGESDPVGLLIDTISLPVGSHSASVTVSDADGVLPTQHVDVQVRILPSDLVGADLGGLVAEDSGMDVEYGVKRPNNEPSDGDTIPVFESGRYCRRLEHPASGDRYMYFDVDDDFAAGGFTSPALVTVVYLDDGYGSMSIQYDGIASAYSGGGSVHLADTGEWREHTFALSDALFDGRQNAGSDFRLVRSDDAMYVDIVEVKTFDLPECTLVTVPQTILQVTTIGERVASDAVAMHAVSTADSICEVSSDAAWLTLSTPVITANITESVVAHYAVESLEIGEHTAHMTLSCAACPASDETVTVQVRVLSETAMRIDLDDDGDIDGDDLLAMEPCLLGPDISIANGCEPLPDTDSDNDCDLADMARIQACGAGADTVPTCN